MRSCRHARTRIILDGPPPLGVADAPLLASATVNVLFVVESGSTRTGAGIEALNRLEATGSHVLGAALTKAPADENMATAVTEMAMASAEWTGSGPKFS